MLAIGSAAPAPATARPSQGSVQPLYVPAPRGPIPLPGAPTSLVGENEGEGYTGGEGFGSVLVGYSARKSSEILWNTRRGLFYLGNYHPPPGPAQVVGEYSYFGVIDAAHRLLRLYQEGFGESHRLSYTLRTGRDPVAVAINPVYEDVSILNRGSADLWIYHRDEKGWHLETKRPIGGRSTDVVTQFAETEPIFVANAATGTVTELTHLQEGAFEFERTIPVGKDPVDLALGEFVRRHDDEKREVVVANRGSNTVTILDGTRGPDYSYPFHVIGTYAAGDEPDAVFATDIDGKDGDDLAVADAGSDRLTILLNDGHGHFHRVASYPTGRDPVAVAELEFDHSFGPDLVVADHGSRDLTVLLRHEPGICRGREARPVIGTPGDDRLRGGRGVDLIRGRGGDDRIRGGYSGDCLYGGAGDDVLFGQWAGDLIDGGPGDDVIWGGEPEYTTNRHRGRDTIIGGPGRDSIHAGSADDVVRAADGERDHVDCASGDDTAYVDRQDVVVGCEHVHAIAPGGRD